MPFCIILNKWLKQGRFIDPEIGSHLRKEELLQVCSYITWWNVMKYSVICRQIQCTTCLWKVTPKQEDPPFLLPNPNIQLTIDPSFTYLILPLHILSWSFFLKRRILVTFKIKPCIFAWKWLWENIEQGS